MWSSDIWREALHGVTSVQLNQKWKCFTRLIRLWQILYVSKSHLLFEVTVFCVQNNPLWIQSRRLCDRNHTKYKASQRKVIGADMLSCTCNERVRRQTHSSTVCEYITYLISKTAANMEKHFLFKQRLRMFEIIRPETADVILKQGDDLIIVYGNRGRNYCYCTSLRCSAKARRRWLCLRLLLSYWSGATCVTCCFACPNRYLFRLTLYWETLFFHPNIRRLNPTKFNSTPSPALSGLLMPSPMPPFLRPASRQD